MHSQARLLSRRQPRRPPAAAEPCREVGSADSSNFASAPGPQLPQLLFSPVPKCPSASFSFMVTSQAASLPFRGKTRASFSKSDHGTLPATLSRREGSS